MRLLLHRVEFLHVREVLVIHVVVISPHYCTVAISDLSVVDEALINHWAVTTVIC